MAGGYVEHFLEAVRAAGGIAADGAHAGDERKGVDRDRRRRNADEAEGSGGPEGLDVDAPVLVGVDGAQDQVLCPGDFLQRLGLEAVDEVVGAEGAGFIFLGGRGGEGSYVRAEDAGELDGHVAEAADADDADARGGVDAVGAEGVVDSDAAAEQRGDEFALERIGDGNDEAGIGADAFGVAAVAVDAGAFGGGAEVLHAAGAPLAQSAGVGLPAEADALAQLAGADLGANGGDSADDLVAGNEGILADAPVVGDQVEIAVADAAVGDGDFHFMGSQLPWVVPEREQFSSRRVCCKSLNLSHGRSEVLNEGKSKADETTDPCRPAKVQMRFYCILV